MPYLEFKGRKFVESYHFSVPHHTLQLDPSLSVLPKGELPSIEGNLIIEGDNLLALKSLLPTHTGKIKCVYLDPPYNTGNEGWVYNDNLSQPQFKEWINKTVGNDSEDATRHDKWCCMMLPRLYLIRDLLADDGAVFISIDDNEMHHLKALMEDVFPGQFVAHILWQKRYVSNVTAQFMSDMHDHIIVYAKDKNELAVSRLNRTSEQLAAYKNPDDDPRGPWRAQDLSASKFYSAGQFDITGPTGKQFTPPPGRYWRCNESQFKKWKKDNRIWFGIKSDGRPMLKSFLSETQSGLTPHTWWSHEFAGHNKEATLELKQIFDGHSPFDTPKPTRLLRRILQLVTQDDDIILDCTAGSGTTGHAAMDLNAEDGGNRRFILTQQSHDSKEDERNNLNICKDITRERIKRVIEGKNIPALGGSFSYARLSAKPLMGNYREINPLASYEDLARYIFYTHTSKQLDTRVVDSQTGYLGKYRGGSVYLLFKPGEDEDWVFDSRWLDEVALKDKNSHIAVYAEAVAIHPQDLREWCSAHNKDISRHIIPFDLR